jgi:hypothetical protein
MQKQRESDSKNNGEVTKFSDDIRLKTAIAEAEKVAIALEKATEGNSVKKLFICNCGDPRCLVMERPLKSVDVDEQTYRNYNGSSRAEMKARLDKGFSNG